MAILVKGKGGTLPPEPVVFTKDYVKHRLLSTKNTRKGRVASLSSLIRVFLVESRIMTSACQTASSYVECPSSTSWPIADARYVPT